MKRALLLSLIAMRLRADSPAQFWGWARVSGVSGYTYALSEDLSEPGYVNRFHLVVPNADLKPFAGWEQVTVLADGLGNMWLLIPQWGWAALTPTDVAVSQWLDGFTAFETRMQYVTITPHEILIEEPQTVIDVQRKRRGAGE